jgi:class 3 adenylate cyclase/tetratricopeptide (TPR) repeat protein
LGSVVSGDIGAWLDELGLGVYTDVFRENDIELDVLADFNVDELRSLGVSIGHAKRILRAVAPSEPTASAATAAGDAERRYLTVVFCDLVGSAGLSERLDPEDMRMLLDAYYRCCDDAARQFGGNMAKVVGDGVDLYFGYPEVLEESAKSAVEAALELFRSLAALNERRVPGLPEINVRVGVHTGLAVVGNVGGAAGEIVGDLPVIAARIQTVARPGSVVVSEATAQLVSRSFRLVDLGPHDLKGLSAPVRLFTVGGLLVEAADEQLTAATTAEPVVGREAEMASLRVLWEMVGDGFGQVVVIEGEAGIGKSKLAQSLAAGGLGTPRTLRFQCSPYRTGTALWPVIEQVRRVAGIVAGEPAEVQLGHLERLLLADYPSGPPTDMVPVIAALLALDTAGAYPALTMSSEQLREQTLDALVQHVGAVCAKHDALVIVEDIQWADPTLLELIGALVRRATRWRLLIVITARPNTVLPWPEASHMATVHLGRLADRHVRAIVERVANGKTLPDSVVDRILMRADGVPLFVEELTRTVLDSQMLVDEGVGYALADALLDEAIPATLQDSLATRLDRLGPDREVVQVAAVIGREFTVELLAEAAGRTLAATTTSLAVLQRSGLIRPRDADTTEWFMFKHALVQNAAYESMLRSTRRDLHARIATALGRHDEVREQQPELLARHLDLAGLVDEAVDAYRRAGERATAGSNHEEALAHYRRSLELLQTLPPSRVRAGRELDVHSALRNALVVLKGYSSPEVEAECLVARALCEEIGETEQLFSVLWNLVGFHMVRADHQSCIEINDRLLEIAASEQRTELSLMAHDTVGQTLYYLGRYGEAFSQFELAVELYDPVVHREVATRFAEEDPGATSRAYAAIALWALGRRSAGRAWMDLAVELADGLPYLVTKALVSFKTLHLAYLRDDLDGARRAAPNLRRLAAQRGFGYVVPSALGQLGWVHTLDGEYDEGIELMRRGMDGLERIGAMVEQPFIAVMLADGYLRAGRPGEALSVLDVIVSAQGRQRAAYIEAEALRLRGSAFAALGEATSADDDLRRAIAVATASGAASLRLRAAISLAQLHAGRHGSDSVGVLAAALAAIADDLDDADVSAARRLLASTTSG